MSGYLPPSRIQQISASIPSREGDSDHSKSIRPAPSHQTLAALKQVVSVNISKQAKGYPDVSTRAFLHLLSQASNVPKPPIFGLMDFDPDGINIISTYKHGSWRLSHENGHLNVPRIQWLGIQSSDLISRNGDDDTAGFGLLRLSIRDRKRAMKMLRKDTWAENGPETEWRREVQVMLMLNIKAEMEILNERTGGMEAWLEEKLLRAGYEREAEQA